MAKQKRNLILGVAFGLIIALAAPAAAHYWNGPNNGWGGGHMMGWYGGHMDGYGHNYGHRGYCGYYGQPRGYYNGEPRWNDDNSDQSRPDWNQPDRNEGQTQ